MEGTWREYLIGVLLVVAILGSFFGGLVGAVWTGNPWWLGLSLMALAALY